MEGRIFLTFSLSKKKKIRKKKEKEIGFNGELLFSSFYFAETEISTVLPSSLQAGPGSRVAD